MSEPPSLLFDLTPRPRGLASWLAETCLPYWEARVFDPALGFVEGIGPDGTPLWDAPRRMRVAARCIHTFAAAARAGLFPAGGDLGGKGFEYWLGAAFPDGPDAGGVHRFAADGSIADDRRDLYDQAFALLACASVERLNGDPLARRTAEAVLHFIDDHLGHPNGGWREDDRGALPRRQNPHMHLFEAFLACAEAFGDAVWLDRARSVYALFQAHFFDRDAGVIREFFTDDWALDPCAGAEIEPGHMMEWTYLLSVYETLTGERTGDARMQLFESAQALSRAAAPEAAPFLPNTINLRTRLPNANRRLWPQTEYLRGRVALAAGDSAHGPDIDALEQAIIGAYIAPFPNGLWCDEFTLAGSPTAPYAPASILYHLYEAAAAVAAFDKRAAST